ncbi:unnamed protein product, partial [marine sediment metagenome]
VVVEPVNDTVSQEIFGSGVHQFSISFQEVGDIGNAADTETGRGEVAYGYRLSTYAIARNDIENAFNSGGPVPPDTLWDYGQIGLANRPRMPATGISWYEAALFVNWLNKSQGFQEAYDLENEALWQTSDAWSEGGKNQFRHKDAEYWLPSFDEYLKAAFYQPESGTYALYSTGSDDSPVPVASGSMPGTLVFGQNIASGVADVELAGAKSSYGVVGLTGNILEQLETIQGFENTDFYGRRLSTGGDYTNNKFALIRTNIFLGALDIR